MKQTVEEATMNFANYESNNLDKLPFKVKNVVDYDNGLTRGGVRLVPNGRKNGRLKPCPLYWITGYMVVMRTVSLPNLKKN